MKPPTPSALPCVLRDIIPPADQGLADLNGETAFTPEPSSKTFQEPMRQVQHTEAWLDIEYWPYRTRPLARISDKYVATTPPEA